MTPSVASPRPCWQASSARRRPPPGHRPMRSVIRCPKGRLPAWGRRALRHSSTPGHYCWGIRDIAWSPDGKVIATTSYENTIGIETRLWDAMTGKPLSVLENNLRHGPSLVRSPPDSKTIAVAARDKIVLWNTVTGREIGPLVGHRGNVDSLEFQDGGRAIVSVSRDGAVRWWDVAARKTVRQWDLLADQPRTTGKGVAIVSWGIRNACFSSGGKTLAVCKGSKTHADGGYSGNTAAVFDLDSRKELWRRSVLDDGCRFAFPPDGKRVVLSFAASIRVYETATGRPLTDLQYHYARGMKFSPDGKTLALCLGGEVAYWSSETKKIIGRVDSPLPGGGYNTFAADPAFSPDGSKLAIDRRRSFQILDVATGKLAVSWPSYDEGFRNLTFSADGRRLFADGLTIDTATWRQRGPARNVRNAFEGFQAISPDRTRCVAADGKHKDAVFDVKSGKVFTRLEPPAVQPGVHGGFFSPSAGHYVMQDRSCEGKEVNTVFALPTGKRLWTLSRDMHVGTGGWSFSADESRVAFMELEAGTVQVRDMSTGKLVRTFGKDLDAVALAAVAERGNVGPLGSKPPGRSDQRCTDGKGPSVPRDRQG